CCLLLLSIRVPAASSLFPYTTLFRSPLHRRLLSAHQSLWIEHLRLPGRKGSLKRLFPEAFESHPAGCRTLCGDFPVFSHTPRREDRKSTRLNSSHVSISYAVFCLKKK